jgi:Ca2+-transporting ATPase
MREMAKRNALVRKMPAVETLGCTSVICSDTNRHAHEGEMTVRRIYAGGRSLEVSGGGYSSEGRIEGRGPTTAGVRLLLTAGVLASDAVIARTARGYS